MSPQIFKYPIAIISTYHDHRSRKIQRHESYPSRARSHPVLVVQGRVWGWRKEARFYV